MKGKLLNVPEYYLFIIILLAGYKPPLYFHPLTLVVLIILVLQIVFKNRVVGIGISVVFFFANLYFLGALLSEFNEFTAFNSKAKQLLLVGSSIFLLNLLMSSTMIFKYSRMVLKYS